MADRVKLYLDVDGVINIWPHRTKPDWPDAKTAICMGFPIFHSPQMGERLRALDVDLVWLTSWTDHANSWIGPLFGWEHLPVVGHGFAQGWYSEPWWKLAYMQSIVHDGPFIWIDDEINDAAEDWAAGLPFSTLLIRPETHLTMAHIDGIEAFLKITCG